jgi:hypothetical protein
LASRTDTRSSRTTIPGSIIGWTRAYRFSLRRCPANRSAPLCASSQLIGFLKNRNRASAQRRLQLGRLGKTGMGQHAWCWSTLSALGRFVDGMPFEEAEIGARKRRENRDRALTTDPGRFNVLRARLTPAMISTSGPLGLQKAPTLGPASLVSTDFYWGTVFSCSITGYCLLRRDGSLWSRRLLVAKTGSTTFKGTSRASPGGDRAQKRYLG